MTAFLTVFLAVLLAEMGDKTQIATALFAGADKASPWVVFLASAGALVVTSAIAVFVGVMAKEWLAAIPLKLIAGLAFVGIGLWTIWGHFQPAA